MTEKEIFDWVAGIQHPGKEDKTLLELGIVQEVSLDGNKVTVTLAFPKHPTLGLSQNLHFIGQPFWGEIVTTILSARSTSW